MVAVVKFTTLGRSVNIHRASALRERSAPEAPQQRARQGLKRQTLADSVAAPGVASGDASEPQKGRGNLDIALDVRAN